MDESLSLVEVVRLHAQTIGSRAFLQAASTIATTATMASTKAAAMAATSVQGSQSLTSPLASPSKGKSTAVSPPLSSTAIATATATAMATTPSSISILLTFRDVFALSCALASRLHASPKAQVNPRVLILYANTQELVLGTLAAFMAEMTAGTQFIYM